MNYLPTCTSRLVVQHLYQVSFKSKQGCRRSWEDKLWCDGRTEWRNDGRTDKANTKCPLAILWRGHKKNLKNCGPPPGNKYDLEVSKRSRSRSPHSTNAKDLSQGSCMPNINVLSLILQKIWARLKFLWQTDGRTDGRMSFNVPHFREWRGTKISTWMMMFVSFEKDHYPIHQIYIAWT